MQGIQAQAGPTPILSLQMIPPSPFSILENYITGHFAGLSHRFLLLPLTQRFSTGLIQFLLV